MRLPPCACPLANDSIAPRIGKSVYLEIFRDVIRRTNQVPQISQRAASLGFANALNLRQFSGLAARGHRRAHPGRSRVPITAPSERCLLCLKTWATRHLESMLFWASSLRRFPGLLVAVIVTAALSAAVPRGRAGRASAHHGYWSQTVRIDVGRRGLTPAPKPALAGPYRPQLWRPLPATAPPPSPRGCFARTTQLRAPPRFAWPTGRGPIATA